MVLLFFIGFTLLDLLFPTANKWRGGGKYSTFSLSANNTREGLGFRSLQIDCVFSVLFHPMLTFIAKLNISYIKI